MERHRRRQLPATSHRNPPRHLRQTVIDIGTKGRIPRAGHLKRQVIIGWELPNELMTEGESAGKPFTVSILHRQPVRKANLRKDLRTGAGVTSATGTRRIRRQEHPRKGVMLSLTMNEKKVRVTGVMAVPKGMVPSSGQRAVLPPLEPGNSTRPRSTLCPTRCRRSSNCLPNISNSKRLPLSFRRGRIQRLRGRHSVLIMTTIYLDLEPSAPMMRRWFPSSPRQPQEGKASPNGKPRKSPNHTGSPRQRPRLTAPMDASSVLV